MKQVLIFILVFAIIGSFVLAAPSDQAPPFQVSTGETISYLTILYPKADFIKVGEAVSLHAHVIDSGGNLLTGTSANCTIHLYDQLNAHIYKAYMVADDQDYEASLNSSVLDTVGEYAFNIWCNTTTEGGFASGTFIVNENGLPDKDNDYTGLAILLLATVTMFFIIFYIINKIKVDLSLINTVSKNNVRKLKIDLGVKIFSVLLLCVFNLIITGYVYYISAAISARFADFAFIFFLLNMIGVFILFIYYLYVGLTFPFKKIGEFFDNVKTKS